jgi:hypothetical protein
MLNPRFSKIYEKHKEIQWFFEFQPFRFEGPAQTKTFKKRSQKTQNNMFFSLNIRRKIVQKTMPKKVAKKHQNSMPKWSQK